MTRQAGLLVLFSTLALFATEAAGAQTAPALELRWQAPAGCPQERAVRERIEQLAGPKKTNEAHVGANGAITQTDDGRFHLKLVVRSGGLVGERNIESKSCEQLAGAAAVALGLLMHSGKPLTSGALNQSSDANGTATSASAASGAPPSAESDGAGQSQSTSDSSTQSTSGTASESAAESSKGSASAGSADASAEEPGAPRRWRARVQAPFGALGIGPLPRPSFGFAIGGGVSVDDWALFLHLAKWTQQHLSSASFPGYGADADRFSASLSACRLYRRDVFEVAPCLVMSVEHLSASGMGERVAPRTQGVTWFAPGVGAQARVYFVDWFALGAAVMGQIEASRSQISIAGVGNLARLGPAAVTVLVGPEWIL